MATGYNARLRADDYLARIKVEYFSRHHLHTLMEQWDDYSFRWRFRATFLISSIILVDDALDM